MLAQDKLRIVISTSQGNDEYNTTVVPYDGSIIPVLPTPSPTSTPIPTATPSPTPTPSPSPTPKFPEAPNPVSKRDVGASQGAGTALAQTSEGDFVMAGTEGGHGGSSGSYYSSIPFLSKTNHLGEVIWRDNYKTEFSSVFSPANSIQETKDLGYIVFGGLSMFKVNVNGTVLWNNTLGSVSGLQSSDGYLVLLTYTTESNSPTYTTSAILRKVDEQGNAAWSNTFSRRKHSNNGFRTGLWIRGGSNNRPLEHLCRSQDMRMATYSSTKIMPRKWNHNHEDKK